MVHEFRTFQYSGNVAKRFNTGVEFVPSKKPAILVGTIDRFDDIPWYAISSSRGHFLPADQQARFPTLRTDH